jgi:hypothetical protein
MSGDTGHGTDFSPRQGDDDDRPSRRRRQLLTAGGGVAATLLAGCSSILPGGGDEPDVNMSGGNNSTKTPPGPAGETHVTGLHYKKNDGSREFFVTLDPSNSGADWWQVETLDGEQLARNEFGSTKTGGRFTTSKMVDIGDGVDAIVVRGHSAKGGYGGNVMLADLSEGYITLERQGQKRKSFKDYSF